MDHVTELVVTEAKIKGGSQIRCNSYRTPCAPLHNGLLYIGKLLRWFFECKSNNMNINMSPREIRTIRKYWSAHKMDLELSQKFSDSPTGVIEIYYKILLPDSVEMKRYKNQKVMRLAQTLFGYAHSIMSVDSSGGTQIVNMKDYEIIKEKQVEVEAYMDLLMGSGEELAPGKWDTGMEVPPLSELGHEQPAGDLAFMEFAEPSITAPPSGLPDSKDIEAGAPIHPKSEIKL